MMKLTLLDGILDLGEEQKQVLLKTPYFEALFVRWSEGEKTEYEVELTVNTVKFLLGEMNQLDVLVQASNLAIQEARRELDMVATIQPVDLITPEYPADLYPLLQSYVIKKGESTTDKTAKKTPACYRIFLEWGQVPPMSELEKLIDDPLFPEYLQLFWEAESMDFVSHCFSIELANQVMQHPEAFTKKKDDPGHLLSILSRKNEGLALIKFMASVFEVDISVWIKDVLQRISDYHNLALAVRLDITQLFTCLNLAHSWFDYDRLLTLCNGVDKCPFTEEQINHSKSAEIKHMREWMMKQTFTDITPEFFQTELDEYLDNRYYAAVEKLLTRFSAVPFEIEIGAEASEIETLIQLSHRYPSLSIIIHPYAYQCSVFPSGHLEFFLQHDTRPDFEINKMDFSPEQITLLLKHQVYENPNNVFLGNPSIATQMFRAALAQGVEIHSQYLIYFVHEKMYDLLPELESTYCHHKVRWGILIEVLHTKDPIATKLFLAWEGSINT